MSKGKQLLGFKEVIHEESQQLKKRRKKLFKDGSDEKFADTKIGVALSGGGIRSATINMGFLKTLNKFGILKRADYISTVSGGGYTGAYIQACLKSEESYEHLFKAAHIDDMRSRGEYLIPGTRLVKRWNALVLTIGYLVSLLMSWISPAIVIGLGIIAYTILGYLLDFDQFTTVRDYLLDPRIKQVVLYVFSGVFVLHFFFNILIQYNVGMSRQFNRLQAIFASIVVLWLASIFVTGWQEIEIEQTSDLISYVFFAFLLFVMGLFTNPNALSFHRFYRNQLADAFLHFTRTYKNVKLIDLFKIDSEAEKDYLAPYPLINTCLNLQSVTDKKFKGTKASDYFLLSPLYCGAKLTKYVATKEVSDYRQMTLPAATTISAAAVNPGMGMYSNKILSVFMTLFNARLGFWITNPLKLKSKKIVWWPMYFFYELFSMIGTNNKMLNISDGGHIENLGVYELLRRRCRLILAVDAGADPLFGFSDLENLTIRARNELGLQIQFRADQIPEEKIRPKPSHGYSEQRFAIADIFQLWEEVDVFDAGNCSILDADGKAIQVLINFEDINKVVEEKVQYISEENEIVANDIKTVIRDRLKKNAIARTLKNAQESIDQIKLAAPADKVIIENCVKKVIENRIASNLKVGTLVYVKSSVTAPEGKPVIPDRDSLAYGTYKYKIYHPSFPHEPTSDQFFDPIQWESYYQLGQFIGADVLGDHELNAFYCTKAEAKEIDLENLINYFEGKDEALSLLKAEGIVAPEPVAPPPPTKSIPPKPTLEPPVMIEEEEVEAVEELKETFEAAIEESFSEELEAAEIIDEREPVGASGGAPPPITEDESKEKIEPVPTEEPVMPAPINEAADDPELEAIQGAKKVVVGKEVKYKM